MKGIAFDAVENRYVTVKDPPAARMQRLFGWEIRNNSRFGCTVVKGKELLFRAIDRGLECDAVVLEYGGNDCDFAWDSVEANPKGQHFPHTPLDTFDTVLREMVAKLRSLQVTPILMTLPPIEAQRYLDHICRDGLDRSAILSWLDNDVQNIARHQELYSLRITTIARETHAAIVDVRSGFLARRDCASLLCKDGIHPNTDGHNLIATLFAEHAARAMRNAS